MITKPGLLFSSLPADNDLSGRKDSLCCFFKRFLNIKVTSLPKHRRRHCSVPDKGLSRQSPALRAGWRCWLRARQEPQRKAMPRCTLHYYIIIIDFKRHCRGSCSVPQAMSLILASTSHLTRLRREKERTLPPPAPILWLVILQTGRFSCASNSATLV